jgi:hypothetical protein
MAKAKTEECKAKILQHLFDAAKAEHAETLGKLVSASVSEAQYYLDELREKGYIKLKRIYAGKIGVSKWEITAAGRKKIMEG